MLKQQPTMPRIFLTNDWGALPPSHPLEAVSRPTGIVLHAMGNDNRTPYADPVQERQKCFQMARDCQAFHMGPERGWSDTGQHLTIWRGGLCTEGRHGSVAAILNGHSILGAHCADRDVVPPVLRNDTIGIELEGTYGAAWADGSRHDGLLTPPQRSRLLEVLAWVLCCTHLDSSAITDHRSTGCRTACPGDTLHKQLPEIVAAAHLAKQALLLTQKPPLQGSSATD